MSGSRKTAVGQMNQRGANMSVSGTIESVRRAGFVLAFAAGLSFVAGAVASSTAEARDIKMAFFASPKHPVWSRLMAPWGKSVESANVGLKLVGFPGSQIGGSPPGAFKRVVLAATGKKPGAELLECRFCSCDIILVAFGIADIDLRNPVSLCHSFTPLVCVD